jgi:cation transport ATPase
MYNGVFPSLNLFLNEEKTMWIIRHMPVENDGIIFGKVSSLFLCFITALPFIPYISIFTGLDQIGFILWFLIFSYIAGIIISVPLGVKYVGKKSDVMLLYSVAMILFVILGFVAIMADLIERYFENPIILYTVILLCEILILYVSLKISSQIFSLKYKLDS